MACSSSVPFTEYVFAAGAGRSSRRLNSTAAAVFSGVVSRYVPTLSVWAVADPVVIRKSSPASSSASLTATLP